MSGEKGGNKAEWQRFCRISRVAQMITLLAVSVSVVMRYKIRKIKQTLLVQSFKLQAKDLWKSKEKSEAKT